ncbi:outer membrane beta-barrel protein [Elizabethkingia anophelis]|uniref:outer membrane beta-barrel protein n=1 Tax=Elizabethkingia anophelis TaxID=1117645 RepID=UPI003558DD6A
MQYNGEIKDNSTVEYLVILTNIANVDQSFSESTVNKSFAFKNIPTEKYKRCITNGTILKCDTINITDNIHNDIIFIEKEEHIKEVVITNKKPLIQNKRGILEVNVEGSPILSNGTAFETLSKLPGITFSFPNNKFLMKGKSGVQIQVDGQILYLSNNEVISYLKSISSDDISQIEINSAPSAKYDASGSAGVINIKTKKIKRQGYYLGASFNGTQGKYYKQNSGVKGQYNTKKSRYMLHYTNSFNTDFENADTHRSFLSTKTEQNTYAKIRGNSNTINTQYEHRFEKSNLLINSSVSLYDETIDQDTKLMFYDSPSNMVSSSLLSNQKSGNNLKNFEIGFNYILDNEKSKFSIKSNYVFYKIQNNSLLSSIQNPSVNTYNDLKNESPNKVNVALSQLDYELKVDSLSKIETGIKAVYQNFNSKNNFYELMENAFLFDSTKSNDYKYNEWILGGYVQYNKDFKKISFTVGSRLEYSPLRGVDKKNNFLLTRDNLNFFPFINISYNPSENNNFSLSYNKRITRPSFRNLMPFIYYVDPYTKLIGNSELKPSISHQLEFQYILKGKYIFSVNYSINKNDIYQTPIQDNKTLSTSLIPINITRSNILSFSSNLSFQLLKWWNINLNGILSYNSIEDKTVYISSNMWSGQMVFSNIFELPKAIKLEIAVDYSTPFIQGAYKTRDLFTANFGISKSFLNNKLKISLIGNDVLKTFTIKNTSIIESQISNMKQNFDTHWVRLGLVYKLTKGIKKDSSGSDKLTEEIKTRVK